MSTYHFCYSLVIDPLMDLQRFPQELPEHGIRKAQKKESEKHRKRT